MKKKTLNNFKLGQNTWYFQAKWRRLNKSMTLLESIGLVNHLMLQSTNL